MSYLRPDRIERRSRAKALIITTLLYGGAMVYFFAQDSIQLSDYIPEVLSSDANDTSTPEETVALDESKPRP